MFRNAAAATLGLLLCTAAAQNADNVKPGVQKLRFIQDDAQDRMVSKVYRLKYVQSNDVTPFLLGIVKRYNMNSSVNCIEYGADNTQLLTVTCPVRMMPYVDDFIRKIDRDIKVDGRTPADVIRGTGITRAVYRPKFRSGQNMLNGWSTPSSAKVPPDRSTPGTPTPTRSTGRTTARTPSTSTSF